MKAQLIQAIQAVFPDINDQTKDTLSPSELSSFVDALVKSGDLGNLETKLHTAIEEKKVLCRLTREFLAAIGGASIVEPEVIEAATEPTPARKRGRPAKVKAEPEASEPETDDFSEYYEWPVQVAKAIKNKAMAFIYTQNSDLADIAVGGGEFTRADVVRTEDNFIVVRPVKNLVGADEHVLVGFAGVNGWVARAYVHTVQGVFLSIGCMGSDALEIEKPARTRASESNIEYKKPRLVSVSSENLSPVTAGNFDGGGVLALDSTTMVVRNLEQKK